MFRIKPTLRYFCMSYKAAWQSFYKIVLLNAENLMLKTVKTKVKLQQGYVFTFDDCLEDEAV